ncbi:MAG: hypothetical protein CMM93_04145 [Rickettsiales bacterium]|nr:hypothetical protein [Rickettsiales bacterium]|tara:strand:+ start:48 stop:797 length:750 start_codon:yes stop_codon:yes gene_type:complete
MDSILETPKQITEREFNFEYSKPSQIQEKMKELFDLVSSEKDKTNWDSFCRFAKSSVRDPDVVLPIEDYEGELIINVESLFESFDVLDAFGSREIQFLIQAMVNKITIPKWIILSMIVNITVSPIKKGILDPYCKYLVDFEENQGKGTLRVYTVVGKVVEKFNWRKMFQGLFTTKTVFRIPIRSMLPKNDMPGANQMIMETAFEGLMKHSNNKSKVARYFWAYLDEMADPKSEGARIMYALPKMGFPSA